MQQGCGENLYNQNVRQTFHHIVIESFSSQNCNFFFSPHSVTSKTAMYQRRLSG